MTPRLENKSLNLPKIKKKKLVFKNRESQTENLKQLDCCICFQQFTVLERLNISITECHHSFCTSCLIKAMKYDNKCPLCRTILRSPTKKITMTPAVSNLIIDQELQFYDEYISESLNYIINSLQYHMEKKNLNSDIINQIHIDMKTVFQNFGMGICFTVNKSIEQLYQSQYGAEQERTPTNLSSVNNLETNLLPSIETSSLTHISQLETYENSTSIINQSSEAFPPI